MNQNSSTLIDNIYCNIPNIATSCKAGIPVFQIIMLYFVFPEMKHCLMIGDVLKSEVSVKIIYLLSTIG